MKIHNSKIKYIVKLEIIVMIQVLQYRGNARSICSLKYKLPQEITGSFYNCPNYDHHFIKKDFVRQ